MDKYQYIFFILILISILFIFGFSFMIMIMKKTPKTIYKIPKVTIIEKEEDTKNTIENFEPAPFIKGEDKEAKTVSNLDHTIPSIHTICEEEKIDDNSKVYVNPFYPDNKKDEDIVPNQNYLSPQDMSSQEFNQFKFGYPPEMTMQDYVNWLYLFKDQENNLTLEHLINFQKLKNNEKLIFNENEEPPPSKKMPPLTSENYFTNQYKNNKVAIADNLNSITNSLQGYNYGNYGDFSQNFNVFGKSGQILNNRLGEKIDPTVLMKFVGPNWLKKNVKQSSF